MRVLIIGGGIAGTQAAEELRAKSPAAEITIIQAEQHPCYSRVLLPHYVKGKTAREKVFLKQLTWYAEKKIELMLGVHVRKIDVKNKFVLTSEERELPYDKLLITTGTEVRLLPDDRRGVSYLSTVDDADHFLELIRELKTLPKEQQQAAVCGSGFIALEFVNAFDHFGIPYFIAMRGSGFWPKYLSAHSQKVLFAHATQKGVKIYTEQSTFELLGDEELMGVRLSGNLDLPVKVLGVGIGVTPNIDLVKEAGIATNDGILANNFLETSVPDVYTAGDVAEFSDSTVKRDIRYGNWMNAQMQGRAVGKTLAGEKTPFTLVSSYATNLLGLHVVFIGDVSREHADEVRQTVAEPNKSEELFLRGGNCVGAILIGDITRRATLTKAIGQPYGT